MCQSLNFEILHNTCYDCSKLRKKVRIVEKQILRNVQNSSSNLLHISKSLNELPRPLDTRKNLNNTFPMNNNFLVY
jgi:hypothetical protein